MVLGGKPLPCFHVLVWTRLARNSCAGETKGELWWLRSAAINTQRDGACGVYRNTSLAGVLAEFRPILWPQWPSVVEL